MRIEKIEHNNEQRIQLRFKQSDEVIEKIKQIQGRKWSKTKQCWHIPYTSEAYKQLILLFGKAQIQVITPSTICNSKIKLDYKSANKIKCPTIVTHSKFGKNYNVVVGEEVIIDQWTEKWLKVYIPYDKKGWQEIVKSINGRRWDGDSCCWLVPYVRVSLTQLQQIDSLHFNFEIIANIPEHLPSSPKKESKPKRKNLPNEVQQKAITAIEEKLLLERKSWRTIKTYRNLLMGLFLAYPKVKPSQISRQQIEQYLLKKIKENNIAISTQNQMINAFKAFYERLLNQSGKVVIQRPVKQKKLPNVFSKDEVTRLLKGVTNLKHKTILALVYSAGLRRCEVLDLQVRDIHFQRNTIHIRQSKHHKDRYVLLSDKAATLLNQYLKQYKPRHWLFEGQTSGRYSETSIQKIFDRAKRRLV